MTSLVNSLDKFLSMNIDWQRDSYDKLSGTDLIEYFDIMSASQKISYRYDAIDFERLVALKDEKKIDDETFDIILHCIMAQYKDTINYYFELAKQIAKQKESQSYKPKHFIEDLVEQQRILSRGGSL